jgi:hypothetical protein
MTYSETPMNIVFDVVLTEMCRIKFIMGRTVNQTLAKISTNPLQNPRFPARSSRLRWQRCMQLDSSCVYMIIDIGAWDFGGFGELFSTWTTF